MKIVLVKAPMDDPGYLVDRWYMPVDLLSVASAVNPERCEVEILDGNLTPLRNILDRIEEGPEIVGISYTILSASAAEQIAIHAKEAGSFVLFGGQAATANAVALAKHPHVDAVVTGDGEPSIRALVEKFQSASFDLREVPNLIFSNNGAIETTYPVSEKLEALGTIDRTLGGLKPEDYITQFPISNTMKNIQCKRPTNIYSRRGCPRSCSFCARIDKAEWRERSVDLVLDEICDLTRTYDLDYILDMSDTWIQRNWVRKYRERFRERQIGDKAFRMHVFADVRDIDQESVSLLTEVHIDQVLLGIESGSPRILKANGKFYTQERILNAVELLTERGIGIYASFVIGLIQEDFESLEETRSLFERLREYPGVRSYCNIVLPLPGSPLWSPFLKNVSPFETWILNPFHYPADEIRASFLQTNTKVDLESLKQLRLELLALNNLELLEYAR